MAATPSSWRGDIGSSRAAPLTCRPGAASAIAIAVVLSLSFVFLLIAFRSIVIAAQAILMNLAPNTVPRAPTGLDSGEGRDSEGSREHGDAGGGDAVARCAGARAIVRAPALHRLVAGAGSPAAVPVPHTARLQRRRAVVREGRPPPTAVAICWTSSRRGTCSCSSCWPAPRPASRCASAATGSTWASASCAWGSPSSSASSSWCRRSATTGRGPTPGTPARTGTTSRAATSSGSVPWRTATTSATSASASSGSSCSC